MNSQDRINIQAIRLGLTSRRREREHLISMQRPETIPEEDLDSLDGMRLGIAETAKDEIKWLDTMIAGVDKILEGKQ